MLFLELFTHKPRNAILASYSALYKKLSKVGQAVTEPLIFASLYFVVL